MSIELFKPYVDFVFKGLFKNSPNALKDFIAAVQGWDPERITQLHYLDQTLNQQDIEGKSGAVDLLVQLDTGERIHFEVQVVHQAFYPERSLYYASRLYGEQLKKGEYYTELQPLVCIHILLFNLFEDNDAFSSFQILNVKNHKPLTPHFNMVFLELNKIEKDNNLNDHLKHWMEFMREPAEHREELEKKQAFQEAYEELEKLSKDPNQKWAYFCAFKRLKDEESREVSPQRLEERAIAKGKLVGMAQGRAEGRAEGIAEGKEAGIEEARKQVALSMLQEGMSIEDVARLTKLPHAILSDLKSSL